MEEKSSPENGRLQKARSPHGAKVQESLEKGLKPFMIPYIDGAGELKEKRVMAKNIKEAREIVKAEQQPEYIQVGVTALRAPDGSFLPAVPLYIRSGPETKAAEEALTQDITGILAQRMKLYIDQTEKKAT